ncbi:MAG: CCA-adding enzyme [Alphaproteobacteria bacterium ADurb.Bin438]|nr:MAG: CCA-adding enzyme [Alphaproteobacteria bacterium ADurb.Bin438]
MKPVGELSKPSWLVSKKLIEIFAKLDNNAKIVGGAVRDAIKKPNKKVTDIDIATPILPDEVLTRLKTLDKNIYAVKDIGIKHGTVSVFSNEMSYEITTLRRDDKTDGRHAEVSFTDDYLEDAKRRDFTFNSLYADLDGKVYDPFGGLYDLSHGIVKFIGNPDERINEDYLRILRFFRFFAYFGYGRVDPQAYDACRKNASKLQEISKERIRDEIFKILMSDMPEDIFLLMQNAGLLPFIVNSKINIGALRQLVFLEGRGLRIEVVGGANIIRRLACLIEGEPSEVADFLKLSKKQKSDLVLLSTMKINNGINENYIKELIEKYGVAKFLDLLLISWAKERDYEISSKENTKWREILDFAVNADVPEFPITGKDLIEMGFTQGERVGVLLKTLKSAWISSGFTLTKEQLLGILKNGSGIPT